MELANNYTSEDCEIWISYISFNSKMRISDSTKKNLLNKVHFKSTYIYYKMAEVKFVSNLYYLVQSVIRLISNYIMDC